MELAGRILPLLRRTCATPFSFRHRPRPHFRRSRVSSRIFLPTAITSISVISLMISKFISGQFNQGPPRDSRKPSNAALERLAHATTNKGYSPASPLQALVGCSIRLHSYTERSTFQFRKDSTSSAASLACPLTYSFSSLNAASITGFALSSFRSP